MLSRTPASTLKRYFVIGPSLAFVAGIVNSVAFLAFGGFVSHVSGHATRSAMEFSEGHAAIAGVFFLATLLFILGASLTATLMRGRFLNSNKVHSLTPLLIEASLIAFVAWRSRSQSASHFVMTESLHASYLYILSFAMGMQNALLRHSSGIIIRTTHMTGIATDMGIAIGWFVSTVIHFIKDKFLSSRQSHKTLSENLQEKLNVYNFLLHVMLFLSFLLGALVGTFGYLRFNFNILFLSVAVLLFNGLKEYRHHIYVEAAVQPHV